MASSASYAISTGTRRANCPRKTGAKKANLLLHLDPPAGPNNAGGRQPSSSKAMPAPVPTPAAGSTSTPAQSQMHHQHHPQHQQLQLHHQPHLQLLYLLQRPYLLLLWIQDPVPPTSEQSRGGAGKTQKKSNVTRTQLNELFERIPSNILDRSGLEELEREEILDALASVPGLKSLKNNIGSEQITAFNNTAQDLIDALPDSNCALYKRLSDFRAQTRSAQSASVWHPSTPAGSLLARGALSSATSCVNIA
ncbi:hypothetical protein LAZ67_20001744 [Cordylochernes scorpioides]|uniref:Uncharacterized protein n=1 Tax=Cordylochernes scorpioides TaxID=51811 RepID=A0ABY6LK73_9ARAC|nr:hypothetical protein LAZ67_20001744 [Cordylochernes scorpioides]